MYSIATTDALVSPATNQELIDWAKLDSDDPNIASSLLVATKLVISFLSLELIARTYTLLYEDWPVVGTVDSGHLSRANYQYKTRIDLPYANALSIAEVKVNDTAVLAADYRIIKGKPDKIQLTQIGYSNEDNIALKVVYSAGFGASADDVPNAIVQAIVMIAAYIHGHAGGCDVGKAVKDSGAAELLTPFAVNAGIVI